MRISSYKHFDGQQSDHLEFCSNLERNFFGIASEAFGNTRRDHGHVKNSVCVLVFEWLESANLSSARACHDHRNFFLEINQTLEYAVHAKSRECGLSFLERGHSSLPFTVITHCGGLEDRGQSNKPNRPSEVFHDPYSRPRCGLDTDIV